MNHWAVRVPATSANLGPGFDALGVAIDRHLVARTTDRGGERVTTHGEGAGELPAGDDNLLWRSFVDGCEAFEVEVPDVSIRVVNAIPLERGLGSSSSAIVAGLALARAVSGAEVGDVDLVRIATRIEGHPDNVAPALLGGFVAAATDDRGELVVRTRPPAADLRPVVLVPDIKQNTNEARGVLPDTLSRAEVAEHGARVAMVVGGMTGLWPHHAGTVGDRLHEPARLGVMGPSGDVITALRELGITAWLSGAGPSVAAAVPTATDDLDAIDEIARAQGFAMHAHHWDLSGTVACSADQCPWSAMRDCVGCPWSATAEPE